MTSTITSDSNSSDLVVILNEKIGNLLDDNQLDIDNLQQWINNILDQTIAQSLDRKDRCEICNSREESKSLERHHIAGRKHNYRTIMACLACHRYLSDMQNTWDARWWKDNQPEHIQDAFLLCGLKDILYRKSQRTGNSIYRLFGDKLVHEISKRLVS